MNVKLQWFAWGVLAAAVVIGGSWWVSSHKVSPVVQGVTSTTTVVAADTANAGGGAVKGGAAQAGAAAAAVGGASHELKSVTSSGETVTVKDQAGGMVVMLDSVHVTQPSWITIKDIKGWALGAKRFDASAESVTVPLLRATLAGDTYQAVIYVDDGDNAFDLHKDALVTDSTGAPVASTFKVQ